MNSRACASGVARSMSSTATRACPARTSGLVRQQLARVGDEHRGRAARLDRRDAARSRWVLPAPGRAPEHHARSRRRSPAASAVTRRQRLGIARRRRKLRERRRIRRREFEDELFGHVQEWQRVAERGIRRPATASNPVKSAQRRTLPRRRRFTQSYRPRSPPGRRTARRVGATLSRARLHAMTSPARHPPLSYRDAGVDIDAGDALVERIKPFAKRTMRPEVLAGIGGFGALVELPKRFREPVLVSGTDGVGTKLKLAFALEPARHDRHRSRRDERQRHPRPGRRAAVLPRLLRLRASSTSTSPPTSSRASPPAASRRAAR